MIQFQIINVQIQFIGVEEQNLKAEYAIPK